MGYKRLNTSQELQDAINRLEQAWKDPSLPEAQWAYNQGTYDNLLVGQWQDIPVYRTFIKALSACLISKFDNVSLLEIGAGNALYSQLMKSAGYNDWKYTGIDFSEPFQKYAQNLYHGNISYDVGDAADLPYPDNSFDVVVSGCNLIHMVNWKKAITEAIRVSTDIVMLHRVPILATAETSYWVKDAYGVECIEVWFGKKEFYDFLGTLGVNIIEILKIDGTDTNDLGGMAHYTVLLDQPNK